MGIRTINYRDDVKLYDIVEIDFNKFVVVSITYEEIALEPLDRWIMRNSLVMYDGVYQSILELVHDKTTKFLADRDKGLVATYNMETGQYEINSGW